MPHNLFRRMCRVVSAPVVVVSLEQHRDEPLDVLDLIVAFHGHAQEVELLKLGVACAHCPDLHVVDTDDCTVDARDLNFGAADGEGEATARRHF